MSQERTISIIQPDAVAKNVIGEIYSRFEKADEFYAVHKERPFYGELVTFMTSGPVMVQILESEDAIAKNREVMGATHPKEAAAGTIRADFAESIDENAVHGSDGPDTTKEEMSFFFSDDKICPRLR